MTNAIDSAPSDFRSSAERSKPRGDTGVALTFPGWAFAFLAVLLFAFLILLGLLVVVSATYLRSAADSTDRLYDRGWALLSTCALTWSVVNLHWARQAIRELKPLVIYGHFAIAIGCGLIALAVHSVLFARATGTQPIVMDYGSSNVDGRGVSAATATLAPVQGDAEEGRKIFSTTCITCHGPTGGGLPNLAPTLRGSPFIASADDAAVGTVIRLGRPVGDPQNKSGKVMPARGGNPFLGDDKVVHLVAFIRAIQTENPGATSDAQDPNAPPPVQLARWVVPAGPSPPEGMVNLDTYQGIGDLESLISRSAHRRQALIRGLTLGLTGVHGLFLFGVMIASSHVLFRRLMNVYSKTDKSWWELSSLGWVVALATWFIVFFYGFVWLT